MPDQLLDRDEREGVSCLIPPVGDAKVGKKVFECLGEILEDKIALGLHDRWLEYYRLSRNKAWRRNSQTVPLVSANLLHTHRQRTVNTLTDNDPSFNVLAMSNEDKAASVFKVQKQCEYWWHETEQQGVFEESVRNGETYGIAVEKVMFDATLEAGIGEVRTVVVDPFYFGVYPVTAKNNQDAEANFFFYPMSAREARRRWPHMADQIKPDSEFLDDLGKERRELQQGTSVDGYLSRLGTTIKSVFNRVSGKTGEKDDQLLVCECWVKDYSGQYPGDIRCIIAGGGGKLVFEDKANPSINPNLDSDIARQCYLYDKFPFTAANSITDTSNFWGMSDFEQLEQLQKEFNKSISQLVFLKDKSARPKVVNPKDSGVSNEQFTNAPGILNPTSHMVAQGIRYLDFPNVPYDVEKIITLFKELFFLVAGTFELENAQTPGREVIAHRAIETLIEHAATMMRGKIRNYGKLLRERGRMYLSHVQNWYTEERWFSWEQNGQDQVGTILNEELWFPLKLTVLNGSTLPRSKVSQREEAIQLHKLGAIDQQDLLEKLDWSNRDEVVKRMQQGPYAELLRRMQVMGIPSEILETIRQVSAIEAKEFDKLAQKGKIPVLSLPAPSSEPNPMENMQLQLAQVKVGTEEANRRLVMEKINTERVNQRVALKGVDFDEQRLRIERAQALAGIDARQKGIGMKEQMAQTGKPEDFEDASERNKVRERGIVSDNEEVTE